MNKYHVVFIDIKNAKVAIIIKEDFLNNFQKSLICPLLILFICFFKTVNTKADYIYVYII